MTLNNLKHEAEKIRLSSAERSAMRARLFGAPSYAPAPSPYFFFSYQFRMAFAGLMLFILAGTGTVSAAAAALPGDLLYPVKINVNEAVKVALAPNAAAKAQAHAELADARVEEAQALAARGKLDAAATRELEDNFDGHAKHAQELALSVADSDSAASVQITTQFDSALAANGAVLEALGRGSGDRETKDNSGRLASRVLAHVGAVGRIAKADATSMPQAASAPAPTMAFSTSISDGEASSSAQLSAPAGEERPPQAPGESDNGAASIRAKAAEVLARGRAQFAQASSTLDAATAAQFEIQFNAVDALMAQGSAALEAGDAQAAVRDFTEALSKAARLRAVLKAQVKYDGDILKTLIKNDD